ncbi:hypothetical protein SEA_ATUIN_324 [Arthrobacter phage Atuin]|nr:hypothetical protein SEA_ATUIN_123 [Arthrobacter phage Atuin]
MSGIIVGRANVIRYTQNAAITALALEINTGMQISSRGSALQACRIQGVLDEGRTTKTGGLKKAVKRMKELYPDWTPSDSIKKAMAPKPKA